MNYRVKAVEAPSSKLGTLLWDSGVLESYEEALLAVANYMYDESLDFGGNPDSSIEFLAEFFDIEDNERISNENYLQWIQRITGENLNEIDLPEPNSGSEVYLENLDTEEIIHKWEGVTIFHPIRGLCTVYDHQMN